MSVRGRQTRKLFAASESQSERAGESLVSLSLFISLFNNYKTRVPNRRMARFSALRCVQTHTLNCRNTTAQRCDTSRGLHTHAAVLSVPLCALVSAGTLKKCEAIHLAPSLSATSSPACSDHMSLWPSQSKL